ncbi:MAG: hypothetical protein LC650_03255, partial [Actinobacteria bacterium]|nr:hypothetical protein [Actinomycetota bacterium]
KSWIGGGHGDKIILSADARRNRLTKLFYSSLRLIVKAKIVSGGSDETGGRFLAFSIAIFWIFGSVMVACLLAVQEGYVRGLSRWISSVAVWRCGKRKVGG